MVSEVMCTKGGACWLMARNMHFTTVECLYGLHPEESFFGKLIPVRFEVFTAMTLKNGVFWI
jgi:hypothetical protein